MREQLERKDQELAQMKEELERKDREASTLTSDIYFTCVELKEKDQELEKKTKRWNR